ncbi:MAG: methyltransferase domain-containing protein [Gloeobacterales cyanobacterium]
MDYLNLGCMNRYHPDWTNVDIVSTGKSVIAHDLTQGIPFPDASFDVVYHSHLLEHIPKTEAEPFLKECRRVLRPQGVFRIVVPDLEQIAKTYLLALEQASSGSKEWASNYEWILLEMYDMTVRNESGGEMAAYLARENIADEFVEKRCGIPIQKWRKDLLEESTQLKSIPIQESQLQHFLKRIYWFFSDSGYRQHRLLKSLLGKKDYKALQIGRLRQSGELHQWMYDRYSLTLLLEKCGLENIVQLSATESHVKNWTSFNLDTEADGTVYKPDSLYIEAIKGS